MKNIIHIISNNKELTKKIKFFSRQMKIQQFTYLNLNEVKLDKLHYENELLIIDQDNITKIKDIKKVSNIIIFCILDRYNQKMIIKAFEDGLDDYFIMPFSYVELLIKVNLVLSYINKSRQDKFIHNTLVVNNISKKVYIDNNEILLTNKEYQLLYILIKNSNTYLSKEFLSKNLWQTNINSRTVDTHICTLRKKIGEYSKHIICKKSYGYLYKK